MRCIFAAYNQTGYTQFLFYKLLKKNSCNIWITKHESSYSKQWNQNILYKINAALQKENDNDENSTYNRRK